MGALAVSVGGMVGACSPGSPTTRSAKELTTELESGVPVYGGTLRVGTITGGASETLDPLYGLSIQDSLRALQLYDGLFLIGSTAADVVPGLATSADPNADGSVWTVRLRSGVTWHDGRGLNADDVIYSIRRWAAPTSPLRAAVSGIDVEQLRKLNPLAVEVRMKAPSSDLPALLALPVLTGIVQAGATTNGLQSNPIGTGPFAYRSFQAGARSEFVANRNYWRTGGPYFDSVVVDSSFSDENARLNAVLSGAVDLVPQASYLSARQQLSSGEAIVFGAPSSAAWNFPMRVDKGPLADVRVRQALRLVADRQALVDGALAGFGSPADDLLGTGLRYYATDLKRSRDVQQAKSLLKQAGQEDLRLTLQSSGVVDGFTQAATLFAQQAKSAGISIAVKVVSPDTYFTSAGDYMTAPFRTTFYSPAGSLEGSYRSYLTPGGQDDCCWGLQSGGSMSLTALTLAYAQTDPTRAEQQWATIQRAQFNEGGLLAWANATNVNLASTKLRGLREGPVGFVNNGRLLDGWFAAQ